MVADPRTRPAQPKRRRWWLIGGAALWAVVLTGLGLYSVRHDPPSVPDQVDVAEVVPAVDRAIAAVLVAAGPGAVVAIGALVSGDCDITPARPGLEVTRDVTVHVPVGDAAATLEAIAAGLPAEYGAEVDDSRDRLRRVLFADAGEFVAVRGTAPSGATVVTLRASSGCRPLGAGVSAVDRPAPVMPKTMNDAAKALDLRPSGVAGQEREITCPSGARAGTVAVEGRAQRSLADALKPLTAGAIVVQADAARYAYRVGDTSMVISDDAGLVRITATTGC